MVTKDYSKSRMRENRTYGSVRGGQSNLIPSTRLTAFQAESCGGGFAIGHTYGVKVLRIDRPDGRRVLKFDGPSGRGLWYRPAGDEYKVSVTGFTFLRHMA